MLVMRGWRNHHCIPFNNINTNQTQKDVVLPIFVDFRAVFINHVLKTGD